MLTPGEIFHKRRRVLRKTISQISQDTKIQEKYLEYLESNQYEKFDSPIFANGFVKIYSDYLGLDVEKMLALYRRESSQKFDNNTKNKTKGIKSFLEKNTLSNIFSPVNIVIFVILSVVIFLIFYLNYQYKAIQEPPKLQVSSPINGTTVNQPELSIQGQTDSDAILKINNTQITHNSTFTHKYTLKEGDNSIEIRAINSKNIEISNVYILNIKYEKKTVATTTTKPIKHTIYLRIKGESAWIKLNVDEKQKYAQVLLVGKTETFSFTRNIEVVSGKPLNTEVFIDGKKYELGLNQKTGIASITCEIDLSNTLICPN